MAEPEPPRSDNGENRLDRDVTPLRGPNRPPLLAAGLTCGVILVAGMWFVLGGEEEVGPTARPQTVNPAEPPVTLVPRQEQPVPPPVRPPPPPPCPPPKPARSPPRPSRPCRRRRPFRRRSIRWTSSARVSCWPASSGSNKNWISAVAPKCS